MKIDKKTIDRVLTLNDDQLWKIIETVASKSGISKDKALERPKDMTKIRNTLSGLSEEEITRITELFKKGKIDG